MTRTASFLGAWACLATLASAQEPYFSPQGLGPASRFGEVVAPVGDVDADGWLDFAVGAPLDDLTGRDSGMARVFSGFDGRTLYTLHGAAPGEHFGAALAAAADANADGHADFTVASPRADDQGRRDAGRVTLFSGRDALPLATIVGANSHDNLGTSLAAIGDPDGDGVIELAVGAPGDDTAASGAGSVQILHSADLTPQAALHGTTAKQGFGQTLAMPGDVNADGILDLAIGAPQASPNGSASGAAWVITGATGEVLYAFYGDTVGEKLGHALAGAGDVDGDGYMDLIVGAPFAKNGAARHGRATVYSGRDGHPLHSWYGETSHERFGWSVAPAGDVDGDGLPDVLVGSPHCNRGAKRAGQAVVRSGADGELLVKLLGQTAGQELGASLASIGDLDGDGLAEVAVGAPGSSRDQGAAVLLTLRDPASAAMTTLASGCLVSQPTLQAAPPPVLGQTFSLRVGKGMPGSVAFFAGSGAANSGPVALGGGCSMHLDVGTATPLGVVMLDAMGSAELTLPLPPTPSIAGGVVRLQTLLLSPNSPLGFDLTHGLEIILGY